MKPFRWAINSRGCGNAQIPPDTDDYCVFDPCAMLDNDSGMSKDKITPGEWWKYECSAVSKAWEAISLFSLVRSVVVAVLGFIFQWPEGLKGQHETGMLVLNAIGIGLLLFLVEFAYRLALSPAKLAKEARETLRKAESETEVLRQEKAAKESDHTRLEIIFDKKDQAPGFGRIAVKNLSLRKSVTNAEVWVNRIIAPLEKETLPSRVHRKDLDGNFRADMLHPSCSELFDTFKWDQHSNVHLCIEKPHGPSFKLKDLPNSQCDLFLDARASELPTAYARFRLKWNGKEVECHRLEEGNSSGAFSSAAELHTGLPEFGGERLDFSDGRLRPGIDF